MERCGPQRRKFCYSNSHDSCIRSEASMGQPRFSNFLHSLCCVRVPSWFDKSLESDGVALSGPLQGYFDKAYKKGLAAEQKPGKKK